MDRLGTGGVPDGVLRSGDSTRNLADSQAALDDESDAAALVRSSAAIRPPPPLELPPPPTVRDYEATAASQIAWF